MTAELVLVVVELLDVVHVDSVASACVSWAVEVGVHSCKGPEAIAMNDERCTFTAVELAGDCEFVAASHFQLAYHLQR
eukprot:COSAG02_NODE_988_length_15440_cov_5.979271_10_plen_78_part_00